MVRVEYRKNASPQISVILQQLYDTNENPRVAGGKVPVSVEILAPSHRPVQVTADLAAFEEQLCGGKNPTPGTVSQT